MAYERLLDRNNVPDEVTIQTTAGKTAPFWIEINKYISVNFNYTPELTFFTKKYGWSIRYRKNKKTLCYLFPENNSFSILIVLGKSEAEQVEPIKNDLNENIKHVFNNTEQLHDGRWLWIRISKKSDIVSFEKLLSVKKK
jgi:hypothetical protein